MKDIRQKKKRTWEDIGDPTRRRAAKSAYEAEQSQYQETPTTGETPPTPPILQEPTGPDERGSEQAELEVEVEEAPTAEGQYESEYAAYLENLNEYGIPGAMERAEEAQAEAVAETRGYDATYWQDPKHVAHWYNAIQSKPPDAVLPEWMTPELQQNIKDAYEFMSFRNGDVPWTEWKYLNANDQALPLLAALPDPPEDFMWPEERGQYGGGTETSSSVSIEQVMSGEAAWSQIPEAERTAILHDPQFDIAAFDPMVRQQILSDPNFNWDGLPPWQKTLFNLQSNPIIGGVVQGMMFGGGSIKGAVLGGVVGKAAEVTGYNPNKWFYEQGNGEPGIQAGEVGSTLMGLLNDLGQLMEVGFGYAGQVLDPLLGGRPDVAMELLTDPVQREAALRASRVAYESSPIATFATNIIKGVSPMFSEEFGKKREALKEQYNNGEITYGEFLKGYGDAWEELSGPWLKPGEQIMMGKSEPVTIMPGVDPKLVWYQAMGQARKAIAAEIERGGDPQAMMESIIQDWSSYAGAPVADLFMQATADPLNAMPFVEGKIQSEIIKSTAGDKVPLFKGGWEEPSKVTAEWKAAVGQMDAAQVGELPAFTRWLAGYNKQGEIMAGMGPLKGLYPNETLTRTTPQEGMKGWAQRVMTLAPENRAKLAMSMAADHMGAIASHLTPAEFDNFFTSLQKMDLEAAKNIAGDVVGSAEFYTILPMLRGFDMNELKTGMWDVSAENRGHLLRLADVLGMEPGRLVEDLGKPDSAARVYEQLRQAAMRTNDSTGKALLEDMQAGRIRVEDLEQIGRAFNGPDAMPWHPAQFQAMVLDAFRTHAEKWGVDYFKIKPGSFAQQLAKTLKGVQGVLLLGYSPKYIIDNVINGEVTMAASGVYGLMTMKQIDTWTKRFGWTPERLHDSALFGDISGVPEGKKGGAIADAMRSKGVLGAVQKFTQGANKWSLMPLAGKFEGMQGARAQTVGMKQMWSKVWERGRGFSKMEAGLESSLRAIDPLLPELVYRAIESGINQKEVMDALAVRQAGVRTSDLVTGAAQKMGMTRSQALSLLETAGVMDALDGYLKGADTPEKVDAAFRSVMKRAEDWVAIRKGQELRNKAEHVANALSAEGENRMWEVILDNVGYRNDQWVNHYLTADEVAATVEAIPDEYQGQKSLAWQDWYEKEQRAWSKTNGDVLTNLKGVMQALGLTHPDAQKLLSLMGEEFDSWGQAYDFRMKQYAEHYETWKGKFSQDTIETRMAELEKRGVLIDEEFKRAFATERVKEEQIRDLLVGMVRAKYGDAVADVTLRAYQQTVDFRAEMTGVLQKHRKDVKNLYGADRRAANRKFYQDDYLLRVVDMRRVWEDGIGEVQKATRGGGLDTAGTPTRPPKPPTQPTPTMAEPMAQTGLDTATITPTRPAVDLTPSPFPNGKGSDAVWKIASENGMSGLDANGNQVFGAKLDVIKFVKKWGGAEGGQVKRFDDITPELMQKAVDSKAAWAKDQLALGLDIGLDTPSATRPTRPALDVETAKIESEALPEPSEKAVEAGDEAARATAEKLKADWDELARESDANMEAARAKENPVARKAINNHISELEPAARDALQYELSVMRELVSQGEAGFRIHKYNTDAPGSTITGVPSTYPSWYGPLKRAKKDVLFALEALTKGLDKPENGLYRSLKGIAADLLTNDRALSEKWDWAKAWGYERDIIKYDREVSHAVDDFYRSASEGNAWLMEIHRESLVKAFADYPKEALDSFVQVLNDEGKFVDGPETYRQYHERLWNEAEKLYQQSVSERLNAQAELNIREAEARGEMAMTREVLREQMIEQAGLPEAQVDALLEMFDANAKTYGPKYGMTPEQFYNRIYGGITKGGLGEMQQTAYHGTPYKFDKFSLDHMGSGEGAQAYGWGLYFAGDKSVADWYRNKLKSPKPVTYEGLDHQYYYNQGYQSEKQWLIKEVLYWGDNHTLKESFRNVEKGILKNENLNEESKVRKINLLNELRSDPKFSDGDQGQLYKVDIPDENYLLWDRPLSEQSPAVREALEKMGIVATTPVWRQNAKGKWAWHSGDSQISGAFPNEGDASAAKSSISDAGYWSQMDSGERIYHKIAFERNEGYKDASLALREAGISGIKYLDGSSRGKGEGSYNYVIFDDAAIQIKETYYQENKGAVTMLDDMKGLIHAYEAADFSTFVHEPAHIFLRQLMNFDQALPEHRQAIAKDWKAVQDWVKTEKKGNTWEAVNGEGKHSIREDDGLFYYRGSSGEEYVFATFEEAQARMTDEMFARGFEKYIAEGSAPTKGLARVFEMAKEWMVGIYRAIIGGVIDVKITDEIRSVFDRLLTDEPLTRVSLDEKARVDALMKETGVDLFAGTKELAEGGRQNAEPGRVYSVGDIVKMQDGTQATVTEVRADGTLALDNGRTASAASVSRVAEQANMLGDFGMKSRPEAVQSNMLFQKAPPTRSEAFKRWFGESKVVDEKGNPLVVYHGTKANFEVFNIKKAGVSDPGLVGKAFYFTPEKEQALSFAENRFYGKGDSPNVLSVYLKIDNPYYIKDGVLPDGRTLLDVHPNWIQKDSAATLKKEIMKAGHDGVIFYLGDEVSQLVVFEPTQIKSVNNRGTFEPTNPNILFQKAELPLGGMDQASGFIPEGAILDEAYAGQIKPLLEAMRAEAGLDMGLGTPSATRPYSTTLGDLPVETQAALTAYLKKVTKREMPAAKLAAVRYGEGMRDFSMLNYNRKYGFDKAIEGIVPYQFWATRTGMNSALRIFDRPAWFANYFRLQRFASRYERDLPDRLKGKIKIELPFLPEWTGQALYVDPYKQLFPWTQYAQPFEQVRKDKNAQVFEAERVLQEWAADGKYSEAEITQAAGNQAGAVWEAALAEAAIRRKAEISSPLDLLSVMLGPAWYLSMPAKALGLEVPFINSKGEGPETISQLPMTKFGQGLETATAGTWAEPLGKLAGLLAKPEQWIREKNGLPQFGEYGEYYIDRQLANMVAEGVVSVEDAKRAMIERGGTAYDEAVERVRMELMLRTPSMSAVYAGTHGGLDDFLKAVPTSILGGGILPEGELRYRGLKEKWDAAWDAYDKGDTEAIGRFFDDHPEYEAYLARGQEPEERLRNMLVGQIWDSYMGLDKATRRVVTGQLGPLFEHSFLNSETRSPESLDVKTLARWSMMLGNDTPTPPQPSPSGAPDGEGAWPTDVPMLEGLPTGTRNALGEYEAAKAEQFANISELQNLYFESSDADRKRILSIYPQLKEYWDWRRQYIEEHPEAAPFLDKDVAKGIISGELDAWDYGMSQEQAERLIGYYNAEFDVPMYTADYYLKNATPFLMESLSAHQLMGTDLTEGAYKELQMIWEGFGKPGDSFEDWLENTIYATSGW